MIIGVILIFLCVFCSFIIYFLIKNDKYCDNFNLLNSVYMNPKFKFLYLKLNKSMVYFKTKQMLNLKHKRLFAEHNLIKNKEYLLTLSKFIDYKINNNKSTYRSKDNYIIIENIAFVISKSIYKTNPYILFNEYKKAISIYKIKNKENKIFKILLAKMLFDELVKIDNELNQFSNIIQKYKNRKFVINYRKNILNIVKYYAIFKYNPNSTKLIHNINIDKNKITSLLLYELFDAEYRINLIITYLKTMF